MKIEIPKPRKRDLDAQAVAFGELLYRVIGRALNAGYHPGAVATALVRNLLEIGDQYGPSFKAEVAASLRSAANALEAGKPPTAPH